MYATSPCHRRRPHLLGVVVVVGVLLLLHHPLVEVHHHRVVESIHVNDVNDGDVMVTVMT